MISRLTIAHLALVRGERQLFSGVSLTVQAGEAVALTGANGAGKTSLLRAVAGLIRPAVGEIAFHDATGERDPDEARNRDLHLLGHNDGLKTSRTAGEELAFWTHWLGGTEAGRQEAVDALDLSVLLELEVRKLSSGQRRRLSLARLIAAPRSLWLLDEPLAPLDAARRALFGELMAEHLASGGMILAAVHDPLSIPCRAVSLTATGLELAA
ncbi:MAG: heme ABC exporter ATP-binding protein CcmA [Caulobacteraceae bacterium]